MTQKIYAEICPDQIIYSEEIRQKMLTHVSNPDSTYNKEIREILEYMIDQIAHNNAVDIRKIGKMLDNFAHSVALEILEEKYDRYS